MHTGSERTRPRPARARRPEGGATGVAGNRREPRRDGLTGLWTRQGLAAVVGPTRLGDPAGTAVVLLDLADFDGLNLSLGRPVGDRVLVEAASRLRSGRRPGDVVARVDGDTFAVVARQVPTPAAAGRLATDLVDRWAEPVSVAGVDVLVGVAAGVCHAPTHGTEGDQVLRAAAAALHRAKEQGTTTALYQPGLDDHLAERMALVGDLARALVGGQLDLVFQPLVDLRSGRVRRFEALARWHHPTRGEVRPSEFVPAAEHTGLARPLARWSLTRALADCARWRRLGLDAGVAVNVSAAAARDGGLVEVVAAALMAAGLAGPELTLELTEWALAEPSRAVRATLDELRRLGVRISIDDFGTGYSAIRSLTELPVDELKIDRSFVTNLLTDRRDRTIVEAVVHLAGELGIEVVAEGVEDAAVVARLAQLGCVGQGYALCRPGPAAEVVAWALRRAER